MKKVLVALFILGASVQLQAQEIRRVAIDVLDSNRKLVLMKNGMPLQVRGTFLMSCNNVTATLQVNGEVLVKGMCSFNGYTEFRLYIYVATLVQNAINNNMPLPNLVIAKDRLMRVPERMQHPMQQQDAYSKCLTQCNHNKVCMNKCLRQ